jgi:hypothetical protein
MKILQNIEECSIWKGQPETEEFMNEHGERFLKRDNMLISILVESMWGKRIECGDYVCFFHFYI